MKTKILMLCMIPLIFFSCNKDDDDDQINGAFYEGDWTLEDEDYFLEVYYASGPTLNKQVVIQKDSANFQVGELIQEFYVSFFGITDTVITKTYTVQDVETTVTFNASGTYNGILQGTVLYFRSTDNDGNVEESHPNASGSENYTGGFDFSNNILTVDTSVIFPLEKYNYTVINNNTIELTFSSDTSYTITTDFETIPVTATNNYKATLRRK